MNMLEALRAIVDNPRLYARPVGWRGFVGAIRYDKNDQLFKIAPSSRDYTAMLPKPHDLFDEWEVVESKLIMDEAGE